MEIVSIGLGNLRAHPGNANVMREAMLAKLRGHIGRHGWYEPLVVRPDPGETGCYQLLNGHHRRQVLGELGHERADCVVWQVDDDEALVLLATLNRLTGADDPVKRSALLEDLCRRYEEGEVAARLPETRGQLRKLLAAGRRPEPIDPGDLPTLPEAMTFFVEREQKKVIERGLRLVAQRSAGDGGGRKLGRGDLLAVMAQTVLAGAGGADVE